MTAKFAIGGLQFGLFQFEQTLGVVENIDTTSRQLQQALESGKQIIVTTLQKFPVIAKPNSAKPSDHVTDCALAPNAGSISSGAMARTISGKVSTRLGCVRPAS